MYRRSNVSIESLEGRQLLSATIAMFFDPKYVNTAANSDSQNLLAQIKYASTQSGPGAGNVVNTFTGVDATSFTNALKSTNLLIIPALDNGYLNAATTNATKDVIRNYLSNGGGLLLLGNPQDRETNFLANTFNYSTIYDDPQQANYFQQGAATGTAFAAGPASIGDNGTMYPLGSLPGGTALVYNSNWNYNTFPGTVALLPFGGHNPICYLGWDFTNGGPNGAQDNGWNTTLSLAIKQVAGKIPGPSTPSSLKAVVLNQTQINLSWKDSTTNVTGFTIQRAATATGTWATVGTTAAGVTTFSNTGLKASTPYFYRVFATGPLGSSADSSVVTATTYSTTFATLTSGKLTITGTADNDRIYLTLKGTTLTVKQNALTQTFSNTLVSSITILDGNGNDVVAIGAGVGKTLVNGGAGNDEFICLNAAPDTLNGGGGTDTLFGNANDVYSKIATVII